MNEGNGGAQKDAIAPSAGARDDSNFRYSNLRRTETKIQPPLEDPEDIPLEEVREDEEEPAIIAPHEAGLGPLFRLPTEVRSLLAGGIAGMAAKSFVAPADRIKILYQVSSAEFHLRHIPHVASSIVKNEGVAALWKGNTATLIRVFPYSGIQFMVFDRCKQYILHQHELGRIAGTKDPDHPWGLSPLESLLSGSLAGCISVVMTYPLDLTRAQLAVLKRKPHERNLGFAGVLAKNYRERGVHGLFRGVTPTILGILPYSGIAYALNEQAKRKIHNTLKREPTTIEKMQCGALSGLFAQTTTYPLEVTRRRMQTIGFVPTSGKDAAVKSLGCSEYHAESPVGMFGTMRHLYKEQGLRGFFKGVSMNWMKGPVAFSISFTTFDIVQGFLLTDYERALRSPHAKQRR